MAPGGPSSGGRAAPGGGGPSGRGGGARPDRGRRRSWQSRRRLATGPGGGLAGPRQSSQRVPAPGGRVCGRCPAKDPAGGGVATGSRTAPGRAVGVPGRERMAGEPALPTGAGRPLGRVGRPRPPAHRGGGGQSRSGLPGGRGSRPSRTPRVGKSLVRRRGACSSSHRQGPKGRGRHDRAGRGPFVVGGGAGRCQRRRVVVDAGPGRRVVEQAPGGGPGAGKGS